MVRMRISVAPTAARCHDPDVARADGFEFQLRADGSVVIIHRGRTATTVRHGKAAAFLAEVEKDDPQEVMARWTGNYRRGNERTARNHPRNAGR
jgi:hypothetical protein